MDISGSEMLTDIASSYITKQVLQKPSQKEHQSSDHKADQLLITETSQLTERLNYSYLTMSFIAKVQKLCPSALKETSPSRNNQCAALLPRSRPLTDGSGSLLHYGFLNHKQHLCT